MQRIKEEVDKLYENLKGVLYRANHLQDEFTKNFISKTQLEHDTKEILNQSLKVILTACYLTLDILSNISIVNDENEMRLIIDKIKKQSSLGE